MRSPASKGKPIRRDLSKWSSRKSSRGDYSFAAGATLAPLTRVVSRAFPLALAPKAARAITPEATEGIVGLLALLRLLPTAPRIAPELRIRGKHKSPDYESRCNRSESDKKSDT
jgi:hypothetical protein